MVANSKKSLLDSGNNVPLFPKLKIFIESVTIYNSIIRKISLYLDQIVLLLVALAAIYLNLFSFAPVNSIQGDTISRMLLATGPIYGLGSPYKDLWEIIPPGFLLVFFSWVKLFGSTMLSLKILYLIALSATAGLYYLVLKKVFSRTFTFLVGFISALVLFSPFFFTIFIPAELIGLLFSLVGLVLLFYIRDVKYKLFFSSFFFVFAGQMKDPYSLTVLAVLPFLVSTFFTKKFFESIKVVSMTILGVVAPLCILMIYLLAMNSLTAYRQVLEYKSTAFNITDLSRLTDNLIYSVQTVQDIVIHFHYFFLLLIIVSIAIALWSGARRKTIVLKKVSGEYTLNVKRVLTRKDLYRLAAVFYSVGSFLGFIEGGNYGSHYLIQVTIPLYLLLGLMFESIYFNLLGTIKSLRIELISLVLTFFVVIFLVPPSVIIKDYTVSGYNPERFLSQIWNADSTRDTRLETYIGQHTNKQSCILSVYGWGVGATYFYAQRKPCTRFFLANIVNQSWQMKEYRSSVLADPPGAIVYVTEGADMNIERFEKEAINISRIRDNCYQQDPDYSSLYFPKFEGEQLKSCLYKNQ